MKIRNLALVDDMEVEFDPGFNALTGETGAGKSVIVGALSLLLGARADKSAIRSGSDRCEVSALFAFSGSAADTARAILDRTAASGAEPGAPLELLVRRVVTQSSSRCILNDSPVTLATLAEMGEVAVDFHGPDEHHSLQKPSVQLDALDRFGGCAPLLESCREAHRVRALASDACASFDSDLPDAVEAEHLVRIVREINAGAPVVGEDDDIVARHSRAANAKNLMEGAINAQSALYESEGSVSDRLAAIGKTLDGLASSDPAAAEEFPVRLERAASEIRELSFDLEAYAQGLDLDEAEFTAIEERMATISSMKRRYGPEIEDVIRCRDEAAAKLERVKNAEFERANLSKALALADVRLSEAAEALSTRRKAVAEKFSAAVSSKLKCLGFLKSGLSIHFERRQPTATGLDQIEFMFCPNPGEPQRPLRAIASSGELARVMLAVKTVLACADAVPILVFDEVDANVGGETAHQVGEELRGLGKSHQVVCISHLAQVASKADAHFQVTKSVVDGRAVTGVSRLEGKSRAVELARMLGGGAAALRHASELLKSGQ